jgi:hypothetical protein
MIYQGKNWNVADCRLCASLVYLILIFLCVLRVSVVFFPVLDSAC